MLIENLDLKQDRFHLAEYADFETRDRSLVQDTHKESNELELKELVRKAQEYNQAAIDELYNRFKGMIINEIKVGYVKDALGEDAENIAWEIFYNTIHELNLDRTKNISAIIKIRLHSRIYNRVKRTITPWFSESLEQSNEDGKQFIEERNNVAEYISNAYLEHELNKLSGKEKKIVTNVCCNGYSLKECSQIVGLNYGYTAKIYERSLRKLRKHLN